MAELAQSFTYRLECRGGSQQAGASPSIKQGRLPPCRASSETATWTNCVGTDTFTSGVFAGAEYVGEFKDGKRNGQGTFTFADGGKHVGEFKDDKRNGQGTYTFPDGRKHVGEFQNDQPNGQGTSTWPDGAEYVGEFKDGKYHGQGTFTFADGGKYIGEFKDGNYHGQGTRTYPNGAKYVGEFKDNKYNGHGTSTRPDGATHVGEFKNGQPNGQGTRYRADGSVLQLGFWVNGVFIGSQHAGASPSIKQSRLPACPGSYMRTTWTNCVGTFTSTSGAKFVGEWRDGRRHGQGTLYDVHGSILLSGNWENDNFLTGR